MQTEKKYRRLRALLYAVAGVMFAVGVLFAVLTAVFAGRTIYSEYDRQLSELANTVDHNITGVIERCRSDLDGLLSKQLFSEKELALINGEDEEIIRSFLNKSASLLTDYSEKIIVGDGEKIILSTDAEDKLDYTLLTDDCKNEFFICTDNGNGKNYIAVSCASERNLYYFLIIDVERFFRFVVSEAILENHRFVLYDEKSGLTVYNSSNQIRDVILTDKEMAEQGNNNKIIVQSQHTGEISSSNYIYTSDGKRQRTRIYIIPTSETENGLISVSAALFNEQFSFSVGKLTANGIISAVIMSFSVASVIFMVLHSNKRERELADNIASLEKEKQLKEEIIKRQDELVHRQRLVTIGTLTAGVAHEFNNLLSPIMGNSLLILEKSRTTNEEIFDNALEIYNASDRAKELILNISKLSRKQPEAQMAPILPEKLINDALSMGTTFIPGNITVKKEINTDAMIFGDEGQLTYMLLNIIINAVQAMKPDKGTLTVSAESDSDNVSISVSDTGKGIPDEDFDSIFDPFFTTKEVGKGTGLGLAIAQRTAVNHGGTITAENLPEGGAKFTFTVAIHK